MLDCIMECLLKVFQGIHSFSNQDTHFVSSSAHILCIIELVVTNQGQEARKSEQQLKPPIRLKQPNNCKLLIKEALRVIH